MNLLSINLSITNPEKNLRIERKLLDISDDYFVLRFWVNSPSVMLGRFQEIAYEVNQDFLRARNIPALKRFSGGGTVYHDLGNLNISFCKPRYPALTSNYVAKEGRFITEIIKHAIEIEEFPLRIDERNGIYWNEEKLLGSAIALKKGKFFYHASLLVDTNLQNLYNCINWNPNYPKQDGKFVKSIRSRVRNLNQLYPITIEHVKENVLRKFKQRLNPNQTIIINDIHQLSYFTKVRNS